MKCLIHDVELVCPKCEAGKGGKQTAKKHANKLSEWGKRGGRPRKDATAEKGGRKPKTNTV